MVRGHAVHHGAPPVRITSAAPSREVDVSARQKRYVISMAIRCVCFVGAVVAGAAGLTWLWPILIAGAIVLPYVAVVMANTADTRGDDFQNDSPFGTHAELPDPHPEDDR